MTDPIPQKMKKLPKEFPAGQKLPKAPSTCFFAVCLGETVIGYIAFNKRENGYETGYCFHSKFHGKGFAKESFSALLEHLGTLGITKITAGTALENRPSIALLKSLGFELIETEKVSFYKDSEGKDIVFEGGIFELNM